MEIYDSSNINYNEAIQYIIDDGIVGFDVTPKPFKKIRETIAKEVEESSLYGFQDIEVSYGYVESSSPNYIYYFWDINRFTSKKAAEIAKRFA